MATIGYQYNRQSYDSPYPYSQVQQYSAGQTPVAIGPVPTPVPPRGASFTPQYPGGAVFGVQAPPSYSTGLPTSVNTSIVSGNTGTPAPAPANQQSYSDQSLLEEYKRRGWNDEAAIKADIANGGYKSWSNGESAPAPLPTYNIRGTDYTGNPQDVANQVNPTNEFAQYGEQFNWDPSAYYANIDAQAGSQNEFLDKSENALRAAQEAFDKQIEADYASNLAQGTASKEKAVGTLGQNTVQAEQRKQDALNSAKQLYNQLQTGYRQRFGGASSAGEASQAILGEEQQRQSGLIGRDYQNTVTQIEGQKADVERQYESMLLDLQSQKQRAINDALQTFQTNLRSIDSDRTQTETAKIQAKQSILLQLRDNQNAIAASDRQYQQQLAMMKEQQQMQLDANLKTLQQQQLSSTSTGQGLVNDYNKTYSTVSSGLGQNNTTKTIGTMPTINTAVGSIYNPQSKDMTFEERMRLGL